MRDVIFCAILTHHFVVVFTSTHIRNSDGRTTGVVNDKHVIQRDISGGFKSSRQS